MNQNSAPPGFLILAYVLLLWTLAWKGVALWRASKNGQRNWFVAILVLNPPIFTTLGILEIVYLFRFAKKRMALSDVKSGLKSVFYTKPK